MAISKLILESVETDLSRRGYIVTPAIQFGFHFGVYKEGQPHSRWLVHILRSNEEVDSLRLIGNSRIAHSVNKSILYAIPLSGNKVRYIEARTWDDSI